MDYVGLLLYLAMGVVVLVTMVVFFITDEAVAQLKTCSATEKLWILGAIVIWPIAVILLVVKVAEGLIEGPLDRLFSFLLKIRSKVKKK